MDKEILDRLIRTGGKKIRPYLEGIKQARQLNKMLEVTESAKGGRFWYTLNPGSAETGRWTSSKDPYGRGGNAQNKTERMRSMFIADPGKWLYYADLEQAESNCLAHLAGDESYIRAHKEGDVHTYVSRMCWPALAWTGDIKKDKDIANGTYMDWDNLNPIRRHAKTNAHGCNYVKTYRGVARDAHIPEAAAKEFMENYFGEFTMIRPYHYWIADQVMTLGEMTSPFGRRRQFFSRRWLAGGAIDGHTHRQAVANGPQGMVADILNTALWWIWYLFDPGQHEVLSQQHDAVLGQAPLIKGVVSKNEGIIQKIKEQMEMPVRVKDFKGVERVMRIPVEVAVGRNWGKYHAEKNPGGIR